MKERFFELLDRCGVISVAAREVGVNLNTAYAWTRRSGFVMRATPRAYSEVDKAEFFRLLAERPNVSAVARELGFTRVTCYKWAHQAGIFTSEARRVNPRRAEFLRLRAAGFTRAQARERVRADKRSATDWDKGITIIHRGRVYPDGRVVRYPALILPGVKSSRSATVLGEKVDLDRVEQVIHPRYLSLLEREQLRDLRRVGLSIRRIAAELGAFAVDDQPRAATQHDLLSRLPSACGPSSLGAAAAAPEKSEAHGQCPAACLRAGQTEEAVVASADQQPTGQGLH